MCVVVLLSCLRVVVLCCVIIETFKAVGVCGVVCGDNSNVNRCGVSVVVSKVVRVVVDRLKGCG